MCGILLIICFLSQGLGSLSSNPESPHNLRRDLDVQTDAGNWSQTPEQCHDQEQCETMTGICDHEDRELVNTLCPVKCGACVCEDSISVGGNCSGLMPDICNSEFAQTLCAKSCNVCGTAVPPTPPTVCPVPKTTVNKIGCFPAEIVFLMEYARTESMYDVYWEGSFIRELVDEWTISADFIRIGLVVFHDSVSEAIHVGEYEDKASLLSRIYEITSKLRPSGAANLAGALNYVKENAFTNARPDVEKIIVPIVHEMHASNKNDIPAAAEAIKDSCTSIIGLIVNSPSIDYPLVAQMVSRPVNEFFYNFRNFFEMESSAKYFYALTC